MARIESACEAERAYRDIENLIAESTPEQTQDIYLVASAVTRSLFEAAILAHIKKGNSGLRSKFPNLHKESLGLF